MCVVKFSSYTLYSLSLAFCITNQEYPKSSLNTLFCKVSWFRQTYLAFRWTIASVTNLNYTFWTLTCQVLSTSTKSIWPPMDYQQSVKWSLHWLFSTLVAGSNSFSLADLFFHSTYLEYVRQYVFDLPFVLYTPFDIFYRDLLFFHLVPNF